MSALKEREAKVVDTLEKMKTAHGISFQAHTSLRDLVVAIRRGVQEGNAAQRVALDHVLEEMKHGEEADSELCDEFHVLREHVGRVERELRGRIEGLEGARGATKRKRDEEELESSPRPPPPRKRLPRAAKRVKR